MNPAQQDLFALPAAVQMPVAFDDEGSGILWRAVPVRFEDGSLIVELGGVDHEFRHPITEVLAKIIAGERFTVEWLNANAYDLELFDFVNVFARGEHVLNALEVGVTANALMTEWLAEMARASRLKDAGRRAKAVERICRFIGRGGFVSAPYIQLEAYQAFRAGGSA